MIKRMTGNAGHHGNGRLFHESEEPLNLFYVLDRKKNLMSISEMEVKGYRVALIKWKGTCLKIDLSKMFLSSGLCQVAGSPLGTMSINLALEVCESDGD